MMRGRQAMAVAVRAPDGRIAVHTEPLGGLYSGPAARIPFVRGLLGLWDALGLGWKSLGFASRIAAEADTTQDQTANQSRQSSGTDWISYAMLAVGLVVGIGLFSAAPTAAAYWLETTLGTPFWITATFEGVIQIMLLIGYLSLIGRLADVQRMFAYHGAEHQTIHAFEAGAELTPDSVAKFPLEHPRCGTAFILTVALISIVLFTAVGPLPLPERIASRLLLIPVVAGIAFEYQRLTARYFDNPLVRLLAWPGLALQRLTTRRPDAHMLEVAICAFKEMRQKERVSGHGVA